MPAQNISREYRIYLAIWRKALKNDAPIRIKCPNRNMAIQMRQGMYRAIRPFRNGTMSDDELRVAAEKFVVHISKRDADEHFVELTPRLTLMALNDMFDEIGIDEEDLKLTHEKEVDERVDESLNELLAEQEVSRVTPFYKRD